MKRSITKIMLAGMVGVCVVAMTGCGKLNTEKAIKAIMEMRTPGISADVHSNGVFYYESGKETYKASYTDEASLKMEGLDTDDIKVSLNQNEKYNLFGILEAEDTSYTYYDAAEDRLYKGDMENSGYMEIPDTIGAESFGEARFWFLNEWFQSQVQAEKETIGFYECYVLDLGKHTSEYMFFLKQEAKVLGCQELFASFENGIRDKYGVEPEVLYNAIDVSVKGYIDTETKRFVAFKLDLSELDVDKLMRTLGITYEALSEKYGVSIDKIGITKWNIVILINSFGDTHADIPENLGSAVTGLPENSINDYLSKLNLANAVAESDDEIVIEEDAIEFSGLKEVPLYNAEGKELVKVQVPDGYGHCYDSSDPDMVNIMDEEGNMDIYVTSSPSTGWADLDLEDFLINGTGDYHTMTEIDMANPIGQAYLVRYEMDELANRYIVLPQGSDYIVVSFSPNAIEDMTDEELVALAEKLF